jgi:hypothetical protein
MRWLFEAKEVLMFSAKPRFTVPLVAIAGLMLGLFLGVAPAPLPAAEEEMPINFDVVAVNMSNVGPRGQARLQVRVDRWSTPEEREKLMQALLAQTGQSRDRTLADTLFGKETVGTIREQQSLAYDLRYSRSLPLEDGGRQVILATDRRIGFAESWRSARTLDYNVSLIILNLDAEGRGEGQLLLGAEFVWDDEKNQVVITNFSSEPIRLTSVRQR